VDGEYHTDIPVHNPRIISVLKIYFYINHTHISGDVMFKKNFFKQFLKHIIPGLSSPPQIEEIPKTDHGKRLRSTKVDGRASSRDALRRVHFGMFMPRPPFKRISRWL
jgi:hypothetical protein